MHSSGDLDYNYITCTLMTMQTAKSHIVSARQGDDLHMYTPKENQLLIDSEAYLKYEILTIQFFYLNHRFDLNQ